jgi:hypothetical protein
MKPHRIVGSILLASLLTTLCSAEDLLKKSIEAYFQGGYSSASIGRFHFSGEAGAGFFDTGAEGEFPNAEFRLDEAKLFVEAQVLENIYVFGEVNLMTRENENEDISIGEVYVEFENISKLWDREDVLNVRAGRFDIPFGEEYQTRDVIDNPLITHALSDIWGVDEGVEIYGSAKKMEYIFAIQNGGENALHDYNSDKAIVGRFTYKPSSYLHFSVSAMRTGELDVVRDLFSEMWFGNGFLLSLGSPLTTTTFQGNVFEADGHANWSSGHVHVAGGHLKYEDNDSAADNTRDANYYQIEVLQNIKQDHQNDWYAVARFSRIDADPDFPIVGNGDIGKYLFDFYETETKFLWRFSLGTGYRIGRHFLMKVEYNFERGEQRDGTKRDQEDFFGIVVAAGF